MLLTARISFRFLWRLALIAVICLGGSLYCLYDGAIGYPAQRQRALAFQELEKQEPDENARYQQWQAVAAEHGWPPEAPGRPKDHIDFIKQYVMAGCLAPPGLLYLFFFARSRRRWIELSDSGLRTSWGPQLGFDQITALDKKKWKTKGIAILRYEENGRRRRLALDDWKYNAPATKAILREVESRIDPQRIVNGIPEPPPAETPAEVDSPGDHPST